MSARSRTIWTFVITSAALFMASLDNLVVTTALPSIRDHLHSSLEGLQWTVNAYTLTFAVLLLTGAALGDRYGRRRMFVIGLAVFTGGCTSWYIDTHGRNTTLWPRATFTFRRLLAEFDPEAYDVEPAAEPEREEVPA